MYDMRDICESEDPSFCYKKFMFILQIDKYFLIL